MDKIKAVTKRPGGRPISTWITPTLENLQNYVGGYIEAVTIPGPLGLVVICNEEGRLLGMPHNCEIDGIEFVGDIILCGVKGEDFGDIPCSYADLKALWPGLFVQTKEA